MITCPKCGNVTLIMCSDCCTEICKICNAQWHIISENTFRYGHLPTCVLLKPNFTNAEKSPGKNTIGPFGGVKHSHIFTKESLNCNNS